MSLLDDASKPIEAAGRAVQPLQEHFNELYQQTVDHMPEFVVGLVIVLVTFIISRLIRFFWPRALGKMNVRRSRVLVTQKIFSIGVWVFGILIAMIVAFPTITPGSAFTTLGITSIAMGFAFKDIIENFLAGILILIREPFKLADFITCGGYEGFIEEITVRDTHIRKSNGQRVVLPNAMLFTDPVTVVTDRDHRRVGVAIYISYASDLEEARSTIRKAVLSQSTVLRDHEIWVYAREFAPTGLIFDVFWWTGSRQRDMRRSRDQVVSAVKKALDATKVQLAFPVKPLYIQARAVQDTDDIVEDDGSI